MLLQKIESKIHHLRGQKVMLDFDLAEMYEVETRALKQAVKRNIYKFPEDFMFLLDETEIKEMVSQFVIPSKSYLGGANPMAFSEQGVAMLSTILKSKKAIEVNITIIRAFVIIRQYALTYKELSDKLKSLEGKFTDVYEAINYLLEKDKIQTNQKERVQIGFKTDK